MKDRIILRLPKLSYTALALCLAASFSHMVFAQPEVAPAAESSDEVAAVIDADQITDEQIDKLILQLTVADEAEEATAQLITLGNSGDNRVILALQRVFDNQVALFNDKPVYLAERIRDETGALLPEEYRDHPPVVEKLSVGQTVDLGRVYPLYLDEDELAAIEAELIPTDLLGSFRANRDARRLIRPVINVLALKSLRPATRAAAAKKLGDMREVDSLPLLQTLADNDPSWKVRFLADESVQLMVALGVVPGSSAQDKLDAVQRLGEMRSVRAYTQLKAEREALPHGSPGVAVYDTAIASISRHISITNWVKNLFFGLSWGSILILLALGLAITFGLMGVINMAHGEMLMIGAVTTWACFEFISPMLPPQHFSWYYVIAFPMAFLVAGFVGLVIEVSIVRFLYKRPLDSLLATIGVSYILIQGVRLWKGDNLGMSKPIWLTGGWEVILDVTLPYNRLFLIALTVFCLLMVVVIFRYTRLGLMIRATSQNREMAQALGVNTRLVDMFSFAFGAGLAGLAGFGLITLTNPSPEMGQTYIVNSFLVTVVGGVGKLVGVVISGLGLGLINKTLEPIKLGFMPFEFFDATWAWVTVLIGVVLFMTRRPAGLFPDKGRLADQQTGAATPWLSARKVNKTREVALGVAMLTLGLVVIPLLYIFGFISIGDMQKYGQWIAFAICAIGLDLVWGYMGVLSLCQFLFFSLGGYCMGLYLINHGPMSGPNKDIPTALYVVMSSVSGAEPPFFLSWFKSLFSTVLLVILVPGLVAGVIGIMTFSSRVRGVYFAILTQAIAVAFWLIFQKNDLKLGGTNGLTNFTHILGYPIAQPDTTPWHSTTRFWMYIVSVLTLTAVFLAAKWLVHSRFGRVLVAIRDDETRLRFAGYKTWVYKAAVFTIAGVFAGIGGMLYVPMKGIITPQQIAAASSILVVVWVALGGRGTLWGPVIGAIMVSFLYDRMTSIAADYWLFVLGGLFILVPLLLPGGVMSLPQVITGIALRSRATHSRGMVEIGAPASGVATSGVASGGVTSGGGEVRHD